MQLLYLKDMIFLKYQNLLAYFIFYILYQIDKRQPDSFKTEMKDNVANTHQNNGKNLYTNGNYFSQLMVGYRGKFVFNRRLTQIDADNDWMLAHQTAIIICPMGMAAFCRAGCLTILMSASICVGPRLITIREYYFTADSRRLTRTTTGCWRINLQITFDRTTCSVKYRNRFAMTLKFVQIVQ